VSTLTLCRRIPSDSKNQAVSAIPRAFQLAPDSLPATTGVKSAAYSMRRRRFTESLPTGLAKLSGVVGNCPHEKTRIERRGLAEVNRLVGEINGKLGTPEWTPLVYINRSIDRTELVGLYKLADVCWVGSLRDGMNLVAKEYVACKPDGDGVLVERICWRCCRNGRSAPD
jgi:trehalose-6-phosphate synthase